MTSVLESAARVESGVAHVSSTWAQVGAVGVGCLAAIVVVGSGGLGAAFMAALAWGGAASTVGSVIDDLQGASVTERLATGAPDVFIDPAKLAAASAQADTITDGDGEAVKTGSDSVFIHRFPAARVTDEVHCGGLIKDGSEHVFYGGSIQSNPDGPSKDEPLWLWSFNLVSSVAGLRAPTNAWEWVSGGASLYGIGSGLTGASNDTADRGATTVGLINAMRLVDEALR